MEISIMHPGKWDNRDVVGGKASDGNSVLFEIAVYTESFPQLIELSSYSLSNGQN